VRRVLNQTIDLMGERWDGKEDYRAGHGKQCEHNQSDRRNSREAMSLQPDNDRIQDHGEQKYDCEKQQERLERTQNKREDNEKDDKPEDAPSAAVA